MSQAQLYIKLPSQEPEEFYFGPYFCVHSNLAPFVSLSSRQVQDGGGQDPDSADLQAEHALHRKEVVQDQPEVLLLHRHRPCGKEHFISDSI